MSIKILVVEDEGIIALDIKLRLEEIGYQVETVSSGEMALKTIKDNDFDVILMDISLSGKLDGIETAKLIKNEHSDILVVFVTGNPHLGEDEKNKVIKPCKYISKPLEKTELEEVIGNYILEACA